MAKWAVYDTHSKVLDFYDTYDEAWADLNDAMYAIRTDKEAAGASAYILEVKEEYKP